MIVESTPHTLAPAGAENAARRGPRIGLTQELIVFLLAVVLFAYFSVTLDNFLSSANILNLIRNVAMLGMLSLGMAVVVIGRGVDLSLVAVMAVSLTFSIVLANQGYAFSTALVLGLALVIVVAIIMGFLIAYVEIPAIFATLAVSAIVYGLGRGVIATLDVNNVPDDLDWFCSWDAAAFLASRFRSGFSRSQPWRSTCSFAGPVSAASSMRLATTSRPHG